MPRSLVTIATDGFRDFVELPDGRTLNLGSVSVLNFVTKLVSSSSLCKLALDSFLKEGRAVMQVEIEALENLLKPKRARWAQLGNGLIPLLPRQGEGMTETPVQAQPQSFQASFDNMMTAFDIMYQAPTSESVSAYVKSASDFTLLVTGSGLSTETDGQPKEASVDKQAEVSGTSEDNAVLKLAAAEVPFVNEGLVHLVAAKVDHALKVVASSQKKGGDLAKGDLHMISTRLDGIAKSANFQDPNLRGALLDLAQKADKVRTYFG